MGEASPRAQGWAGCELGGWMWAGGLAGVSACCHRVTSARVGTSGFLAFIPILRAQPSTLQTGEVVRGFRLCSLQRIKNNPNPPKDK